LSKNKDISDEIGLVKLAEAIAKNKCIQTIDLNGLKIRKPCLKQHWEPALKKNIVMHKIKGKLPQGIIDPELETNLIIEERIIPHYEAMAKPKRGAFDLL